MRLSSLAIAAVFTFGLTITASAITDPETKVSFSNSSKCGGAAATAAGVGVREATFGIDVVEHGGSMTDETIQLLLDKKIPIVTTFAPLVMQSQPDLARQYNIPEWKIAERQRAVADPTRYQGLVNAANAGVTIAFGTDAGSPVVGHHVIAPEMAFMVKLGVKKDNYDAIRSATSVAAQINDLAEKLGTLEVGKLADIVVVDGNPLDDLDALENVTMTFKEGKRMV